MVTRYSKGLYRSEGLWSLMASWLEETEGETGKFIYCFYLTALLFSNRAQLRTGGRKRSSLICIYSTHSGI